MTQPLRVLHCLWQGNTGGAERAVFQLVQAQATWPQVQVGLAFGQAMGQYAVAAREQGILVHDLRLRAAYDVGALARTQRLFATYNVHHFHVAEPLLMYASWLVRHACRVYTYRAGLHSRTGRRALRFFLVRHLLTKFQGISANTRHGARAAEGLFGLPTGGVAVTYNGLNFELLSPRRSRASARLLMGLQPAEFVIGTVSVLKTFKRIGWLLEAASKLSIRHWRLLIVGDGPERAQLQDLAVRLGIHDRTIFAGLQTRVADWLVAMDAFALPSSSGESFGNAAVEAMALGIPTVVCDDSGGLTEHIQHMQTGMIAHGISGIAECLALLAHDAGIRQTIGFAGQAAIRERYTVEQMLAAYAAFYHRAGVLMPGTPMQQPVT